MYHKRSKRSLPRVVIVCNNYVSIALLEGLVHEISMETIFISEGHRHHSRVPKVCSMVVFYNYELQWSPSIKAAIGEWGGFVLKSTFGI